MRLEVDLRFDAPPERAAGAGGNRRLDLHTLAGAARAPRRLWRLLRRERYDEVRVDEGELPLSAVQAACLLFVSAVPSSRFQVGGRELGRGRFTARALLQAARAVPSELVHTATLLRYVSGASRRRVELPVHASATAKALYLRVDPTLNWMGLQVGGAATHTRGVINGLLDNGVEVEVLAPERPLGTERASFVPVRVKRVLHLVPGLSYADYSRALVSAGSGRAADFVYQRYQLASDAGLNLARQLGVPLVLEFNGSELWVASQWNSGNLRFEQTLGRLERRNLTDASLVVVVSSALRETVIAAGADPARVLVDPNGVDIAELAPFRSRSAAQWRAHAGLPDEPTVGFIGTFGPWHGVRLLPALVEAVPDARWLIVGDGDLFPEVQAEMAARGVSDRAAMTGLLERPRALEMLACCDVCVSPHVANPDGTPFFGSPTKLFEYMGLRKPIVASNLDQIGEVLTDGTTALLVPPGDVDATAEAIRRLLADEDLRERLGAAAFLLASAEYSWTAHVRRILDALR